MAQLRCEQLGFVVRDADESQDSAKVLVGRSPAADASLDAAPRRAREAHVSEARSDLHAAPQRQEKAAKPGTQRHTSEKWRDASFITFI